MGMSVALVTAMCVLIVSLRHFILGIYTTDPEVIRVGACLMLWTVPFNWVFMPVEVYGGAMRGVGYSLVPTIITSICICLFRVIWLATVVARFHVMELLVVCYPITWALCAIAFHLTYRRGNWLKKRIAECGFSPE